MSSFVRGLTAYFILIDIPIETATKIAKVSLISWLDWCGLALRHARVEARMGKQKSVCRANIVGAYLT